MPEDEEEIPLTEGMAIENEEGERLGTLGGLLVEEEEEEPEFFILQSEGADRLVPYEAIVGVGDGSLVVDVPSKNVARFPAVRDEGPTEDEIELAYSVFDEGATGD